MRRAFLLPIVNNKIEIYVPASGVYETRGPGLTAGAVAPSEHQFYFEHDGRFAHKCPCCDAEKKELTSLN